MEPVEQAPRGPLVGIRVIDVGRFIAGPVAATLLAEFGADVIKVERPGIGDDLRRLGWLKGEHSLWWSVEARNKRSVTLDLHHPRGQDLFLRLAETADVVTENFRPGTLERWGLSWERLSQRNPRLIMLRTSGFGQSGPYSPRAAFNTAAESLGGLRYIMGEPDRPPARPGIALGDYTGALTGALGVLLALYERDRGGARGQPGSGQGQWVDNALYEAVMRLTEYTVAGYQHLGRVRERVGGGSVGTVPARSFLCRDEVWVGISAANDAMFGRLCEAMGMPDLAADPIAATNAARIQHRDRIHAIIEAWAAGNESAEVVALLQRAEVSAFQVYSAQALMADPHVHARQSIIRVHDPLLGETAMQAVVPRLSRTPGAVRHAGPALGADNERVYTDELGIPPDELRSLQTDGVI